MLQDRANWLKAVREELQSLKDMQTWVILKLLQLLKRVNMIKSKWVFKRKSLPNKIVQYKGRLVICRDLQKECLNFMEMFTPTSSLATHRQLLAVAAAYR